MVSVNSRIQRKLFGRLRGDRRGTAEVIGSVMFVLILFYAFTNFYLWHDSATREMNGVLAEKMNSPVSIELHKVEGLLVGLNVTNNGGFEVRLSRLWLITGSGSATDHIYVDLENSTDGGPLNVRVATGAEIQLLFVGEEVVYNDDGSIRADPPQDDYVEVYYPVPDYPIRCKILTTLGNMAACKYPD
jgi:hypothetical protein